MDSIQLAKEVEERTGREARAVVPGHIQRGGTPSGRDRILASLMATKAVELLYDDEASKAIGIVGNDIVYYDMAKALEIEREFGEGIYDLAEVLS